MKLSQQQEKYIRSKGLSLTQVKDQIILFKQGTRYLDLVRPAILKNGIEQLDALEIKEIEDNYTSLISNNSISKFIPASGAATRMFKDLYTYLATNEETIFVNQFIENIKDFAFYQDLKDKLSENSYNIDDLLLRKSYSIIIDFFLNTNGLNYGNLPKGLLLFHKTKTDISTPVAEHIKEALAYAGDNSSLVFTISEEFKSKFKKEIERNLEYYKASDISYKLTYQKPETDTIAVDTNFNVVSINNTEILLRPGGHGSLIENLNDVNADIIFIKNIDNVCADKYIDKTVKYKKLIAGVLLDVQAKVFEYSRKIENYKGEDEDFNTELEKFIEKKLYVSSQKLATMKPAEKVDFYKSKLNRPIRVCGMGKKAGEPGGCPCWVRNNESISLQIVESSQINLQNKEQNQIFLASSHFNPVDIVCSVIDSKGEKYNLTEFVDKDAYFIAQKSFKGKEILALEHPGLWNGGMGDWNTIFVEVSSLTFNPVKTVNDLLRKTHQN